jgi:hypothetical protein
MAVMTLAEITLQYLTHKQRMQTHIPRIREFSPATAEPRASRLRALVYRTHLHHPTKQVQTRRGPGAGTSHPQYRRRSLVRQRTTCKHKARCIHLTLSGRLTFYKLASPWAPWYLKRFAQPRPGFSLWKGRLGNSCVRPSCAEASMTLWRPLRDSD